MKWNDKSYNNLNHYLKEKYDCKVIKLSIDGGFTCPNRDGTVGNKGCIFCSEMGSGDFAGCGDRAASIHAQMTHQTELLKDKWPNAKYIAYFQSFTNTYDTVDNLRSLYKEALSFENVVGLAIATRADCLSDEVVQMLKELNEATDIWIEVGLQSYSEDTNKLIRRGYSNHVLEEGLKRLKDAGIDYVLHVIAGLPGEDESDFLKSIRYVNDLAPMGIKIHLLHILKNTELYSYYEANPFKILTYEEYIQLICDSIEILDPKIVIHRLTGDAPKELLFEPWWALNKRRSLNGITKELKERDSYQGKFFKAD